MFHSGDTQFLPDDVKSMLEIAQSYQNIETQLLCVPKSFSYQTIWNFQEADGIKKKETVTTKITVNRNKWMQQTSSEFSSCTWYRRTGDHFFPSPYWVRLTVDSIKKKYMCGHFEYIFMWKTHAISETDKRMPCVCMPENHQIEAYDIELIFIESLLSSWISLKSRHMFNIL